MARFIKALISLVMAVSLGFLVADQSPARAQSPTPLRPALISWASAIPPLPGIKVHLAGTTQSGLRQQLDGMDISDSEFRNMDWEYSGGDFSLKNVKFSAPMRVTLSGAAANTLILLSLIHKVNSAGNSPSRLDSPLLKNIQAGDKMITIVFATTDDGTVRIAESSPRHKKARP